MTTRSRATRLLVYAALVVLSIGFTWPVGDLGDPVLPRHDDPLFSVWRLAWVAHQLPRDPAELFNANIFFPAATTFAYSDAMLFLGVVAAPPIWLGVPPLVVHNVLVILAFVTAGVGAMRLAAYFTSSLAAQLVAGLIFAFAPYRVAHIVHLELLWTAFIPLAVLALYRVLEQPSLTRAVTFGTCVGLQTLCSVYYGVFLIAWLIPALILAHWHVPFRWSARHVKAALVSVVVAAVLVSPYVVPYASARRTLGPRPANDLEVFSAQLSDYWRSSPHNRVYTTKPSLEQDERSLFPGAVALILCALALVLARTRVTAIYAALTLVAVDLSLGVHGTLLPLIGRVVPILDGLRAPARFGVFTLLGIAILAALGTGHALASRKSSRERVGLTVLLALALVAEYWAAPITAYRVPIKGGEMYSWLASQPRTVVAALPLPEPGRLWAYETVFQYLSIFHWQPMVNGYSGYAPQTYFDLLGAAKGFPSDRSVKALRDRGVQLVILHDRYGDPGEFDRNLYACHDRRWFSDVIAFDDRELGRSAICRIAPAP